MINLSDHWRDTYPDAHVGFLVMRDVINPAVEMRFEQEKKNLEVELRNTFGMQNSDAVRVLPTIQAYTAYYKRFKKTYHVFHQLESLVFKGKSIPSVSCLVEAMFMAELKNQLLTAGHDLDHLKLPLIVDSANGAECYVLMRGDEQHVKVNDMLIADQAGVISTIIYGPDQRTQITSNTQNVLFSVYAPVGIDAQQVQAHLEDIQNFVLIFSPAAKKTFCEVLPKPK